MRFLIFHCFLLLTVWLGAHEEDAGEEVPSVAALEGLPSSLVNQSVCAISGEYVDQVVDLALPGPEPLIMYRSYSSLDARGNLGNSWGFNHRDSIWLDCKNDQGIDKLCFLLTQPSGARLYYSAPYPASKHPHSCSFALTLPKGLTNCAGQEISGRTNIKNQKAVFNCHNKIMHVTLGTGAKRTFKELDTKHEEQSGAILFQMSEKKLNGNGLIYTPSEKTVAMRRNQ